MSLSGYTVEVTNLSPNATERDLYDFFSFSGAIEHIEIIRSGEHASTAYVTFRDPHALETAVLLSGATIIDQHVCIARWGYYDDDCSFWSRPSHEDQTQSTMPEVNHLNTTPREAVTMAQEVVKTMLATGYQLSKDALIKAKAFDESHHVTATAAAMVADLSNRSGLTDKINAGLNAVTSVDERYHLSATTKAVVSTTTRTAANITNSVVSSSYFSAGALLVSDALNKAAKVAADLATHGAKR
ncbi:unnamed protein product [Musa textilis]